MQAERHIHSQIIDGYSQAILDAPGSAPQPAPQPAAQSTPQPAPVQPPEQAGGDEDLEDIFF